MILKEEALSGLCHSPPANTVRCRSQRWLMLHCSQKLFFKTVLVTQLLFGLIPWNGNALLLSKLHKQHYAQKNLETGKNVNHDLTTKTPAGSPQYMPRVFPSQSRDCSALDS